MSILLFDYLIPMVNPASVSFRTDIKNHLFVLKSMYDREVCRRRWADTHSGGSDRCAPKNWQMMKITDIEKGKQVMSQDRVASSPRKPRSHGDVIFKAFVIYPDSSSQPSTNIEHVTPIGALLCSSKLTLFKFIGQQKNVHFAICSVIWQVNQLIPLENLHIIPSNCLLVSPPSLSLSTSFQLQFPSMDAANDDSGKYIVSSLFQVWDIFFILVFPFFTLRSPPILCHHQPQDNEGWSISEFLKNNNFPCDQRAFERELKGDVATTPERGLQVDVAIPPEREPQTLPEYDTSSHSLHQTVQLICPITHIVIQGVIVPGGAVFLLWGDSAMQVVRITE